METNHKVIKLLTPWTTLPNVTNIPVPKKPTQTAINEQYVEEFTESALRSLALQNKSDLLPGLSTTEAKLNALPADFLLEHYLHLRYRRKLSDGYYALRSDGANGMRLSTSVHSLAGLSLMALVLKALLDRVAVTIDPSKIREARDILLLLREVQFAIYNILQKYPTGVHNGNLIIGAYTEITRLQSMVEEIYWVLFDEATLNSYVAAGHTVDEAVAYWLANRQQPTW